MNLHNLKIDIDENLKERVYKYAGFGFSNNLLSGQELNYKSVFEAIDLGTEFKRICRDFELDTDVAAGYIKKYTLHLITKDVINLKYPSKKILMKLKGQEIKGQKITDILDEIFFKIPRDLFDQLSYIDGFFTPDQINQKLENEYDWNSNDDESTLTPESREKWENNKKKVGSFYPLYVKYASRKSRLAQSLVKPFNKITDFDKEFLNKQIHFTRFVKALEQAEFDTSQDVWSFEYNTFLFMLQKIGTYKNIDELDKEYFPVVASFLFVGDIRLKLSLIDAFFKNSSWSYFKNKQSELFQISFIIVPFLKEFITNKLMELIPESVIKSKSSLDNDQNEMKIVDLKKKLYIYQTFKNEKCYCGESLASEFGINTKNELTVTEELKVAWKQIEHASGTINMNFNSFFQKFLNHLAEFDSFLDSYNGEELTLTFKSWIEVGIYEATQEYRDTLVKNKNSSNHSETKDMSDLNFKGKSDEELKKLWVYAEDNRQMHQKKLNKIIGYELGKLGIDVNKIKEISKKYNCSITIEPTNVINKTIW
ncbi:hypothetical protein ACQKL5_19795 [Peribacillus sp. NPDC097675]|uniref:hypothetical protein n=1 Tax=Peribacillus sp. NPDC097675 TaxID=3390618 RepID=UPI003D0570DD